MTQPLVYGSDPPHGPEPGHEYRELTGGGPLDGQIIDVTGYTDEQRGFGAYLIADNTAYDPGGRAAYAPPDADPTAPWEWEGDIP
ncbi:hypothetical protein [Streptomyces ramulosus]|uniref:hypothetical protein n=1 Tax=Streptomyces TaxID=1883 RepID=UPI0031E8498D